ncbi:methyltransferase family protein [Kineothrix alysoides]|uniref:Methyltransferase family protein n=1 Tax=Kineothrix alysoides TaxID=1469948 RepID=A0A4R1QYN6_9FIRM|nr:class I SAM-dependent methyltransferase [Kineothrix alysoides]TCL58073.1 methyltransferase family protein [Kineothrix alysoides]
MYQNIDEFYNNECLEEERLNSGIGQIEYITTMKYMKSLCPPNSNILDACAGAGKYAFQLAQLGHNVTAGDLVEINVEKIKEQNKKVNSLIEIYQGSILDLSRFKEESFDVVLNLGAYYHLLDSVDRKKSIQECLKVLRKGGLYFMSYINRFANYIGHADEMNRDFGMFENFLESGTVDNVFFCSTPEMVESDIQESGLRILHNIGTDGCIYNGDIINSMSDDTFERYMKVHLSNCEVKSILGCSSHGLVICTK